MSKSISASVRMGLAGKKMEQIELASIVNVRRETVSSWCNGHSIPLYERQVKIAAAFGVSHSDFIKWGEL